MLMVVRDAMEQFPSLSSCLNCSRRDSEVLVIVLARPIREKRDRSSGEAREYGIFRNMARSGGTTGGKRRNAGNSDHHWFLGLAPVSHE